MRANHASTLKGKGTEKVLNAKSEAFQQNQLRQVLEGYIALIGSKRPDDMLGFRGSLPQKTLLYFYFSRRHH